MPNTIVSTTGALTGSLATIYTVPANLKFVIKALTIANDTGGALNLTVDITTTSGGTARTIIPPRNINDKATDLCVEVVNHMLETGGIIEASGNGLEYILTGVTL